MSIGRNAQLFDAKRRVRDGGGAGRGVGIFLRIWHFARAEGSVPLNGIVKSNAKNHVAAFITAVPDDVLPVFFMVIGLLL